MPGGPEEQHTRRDLRAHLLELRGRGQELSDLLQLLDRLVEAGDVGERDLRLVLRYDLGLRLAEAHDAAPAALHATENPEQHQGEQRERQEADQQAHPRALVLVVGVHVLHTGIDEVLGDRSRVAVGEVDQVVGSVLQLTGDAVVVVVDGGRRDLALLETP